MKACIIGKGSIGKRHYKLLKKLNINAYFIRRKKKNISDLIFTDLKKFTFNYFLITNPTSLHRKTLMRVIGFNKPIFIEKPFCNKKLSKKDINLFLKKYIYVGYMLRYDKRIQKLKKIISRDVNYSKIIWQTYMPNWHPGENFKKSYASKKELGGGVVYTCSHEIDLAIYLFGHVKKVSSFRIKNRLKMNVEDRIQIILEHYNGQISEIYLDFTNQIKSRKIKVYLGEKILEWDFFKKYILEYKQKKVKRIYCKYKNLDQTYLSQNIDFLKNKKNNNRISFKNTLDTQLTIEAIMKSLISKKAVEINEYHRK